MKNKEDTRRSFWILILTILYISFALILGKCENESKSNQHNLNIVNHGK